MRPPNVATPAGFRGCHYIMAAGKELWHKAYRYLFDPLWFWHREAVALIFAALDTLGDSDWHVQHEHAEHKDGIPADRHFRDDLQGET